MTHRIALVSSLTECNFALKIYLFGQQNEVRIKKEKKNTINNRFIILFNKFNYVGRCRGTRLNRWVVTLNTSELHFQVDNQGV